MHRSNPVPRLIGWWSLLVGFSLHAGLATASAQEQQPVRLQQAPQFQPLQFQQPPAPAPVADKTPEVVFLAMTVGSAQPYSMGTNFNLKKVENPNPKVINVSKISDNLKAVLFDAVGLGRTRIKITDEKDNVQYVEVVVVSDLVKQLRDMIQRAVPSAAVTVTPADNGRTVVLTGFVKTLEDGKAVMQIAGQMFGVTVINQVTIGGVQQVQLEVVIASVNRSLLRAMSFSWVNSGNQYFVSSILPVGTAATFANVLTAAPGNVTSSLTGPSGANLPFGLMTNKGSFQAFLQALRTEGLTKNFAEPRVTTMSGRPANIVSGGEVPVLTSSGLGAPSVSYKQFGTVVSVLPIVKGNGKIHLEVKPEISAVDPALGIQIAGTVATSVVGFKIQAAQVAVEIEDGQTLAIGGLIQNDITATITRLPILGDLPFIGVAFTSKTYTETEQELIILVTPRLVHPVDCTQIPKYLPTRESRSPDDFELFLEGIIEAPRGPRNLTVAPHGYKAAFQSSPNIGQLPCNDATGCSRGNCSTGACGAGNYPTTTYGVPITAGQTIPASSAPMAAPRPVSVPTMPPASSRSVPVSTQLPAVVMPSPAPLPSQGVPSVPMAPTGPPAREMETRPLLPPVSFGPAN